MRRMMGLGRQRRLQGRFGLVDGIPFELPVNSSNSPAMFAGFTIDVGKAAALLPGEELHPLRLLGGRGLLAITVIDYRATDIGKYIEFSIAIVCTHGPRPALPLVAALRPRHNGIGQYVLDLPVSSVVSVKGGKGIWGMPKHQANLDFVIDDDMVSSQYDLDGKLAMRIDVEQPRGRGIPLRLGAANYCAYRGLLMKSYIYFRGPVHAALGPKARARMILGEHPRMDPLRDLDVSSKPLFTAFFPRTNGVLDDYIEAWFITHTQPPQQAPEGLESVIDLDLSEDWLTPPGRTENR